jgi:hydrogenase-4 component B
LFVGLAGLCIALAGRPRAARWLGYGGSALGGGGALLLAIATLQTGQPVAASLFDPTPYLTLGLRLDPLAAAFTLALGAATLAVSLAALGYARAYDHHGGPRLAAWYCLFVGAMLLVLLADGLFGFLLAWEAMSLVGYLLVTHEHAEARVRRAGFVYLVMAHLGTGFILLGFLALAGHAGQPSPSFAQLAGVGAALPPWLRDLIFVALLIGFATKAGAVPLHVWLPRAHPVAPAHVSALMSGVMLKTALYGLARSLFDVLGPGPSWWGWLVLGLGLLSAVLGVLYAVVERDLKRLLAYSSIENVGIVLVGFGAAIVLTAAGQSAAAPLALTAGLFHVVNHALFKSLLFVAAGAVDQAAHTRDLDRLGGLIRTMPSTAGLFLVGAAAIAALPPLNGFASEWLTLQALLQVGRVDGLARLAAWLAAALLALTGGLAAAAFAKTFGIAFLGLPRSPAAAGAREAPLATRLGLAILALTCLGIGLLPGGVPALLAAAVGPLPPGAFEPPLALAAPGASINPSAGLGVMLLAAAVGWLLFRLLGPVPVRRGAVWVCGFSLAPGMQYSATAFAEPLRLFFRGFLRPRRKLFRRWALEPYFVASMTTRGRTAAPIERRVYAPVAALGLRAADALRVVQSGSLRLYLLYVFATLVALLLVATR